MRKFWLIGSVALALTAVVGCGDGGGLATDAEGEMTIEQYEAEQAQRQADMAPAAEQLQP